MNLSEMTIELKSILGNRDSSIIADSRYELWLNNSEIDLASSLIFFETEKWYSRSTVVGSRTYALPSDCLAIYSLRDHTNKRKITRTGFRKIDNLDFERTGVPTNYIRYTNTIQLYPTPSTIVTLYLRCCKTLTPMTSLNPTPTLPIPWHEAILLGAEWRGWKALREVEKALLAKQELLALVRSKRIDTEIEDSDEEFGFETA